MTTLSQTDIFNLALSKVGAEKVNDLSDTTNTSVVECLTAWPLAILEITREHNWNCLQAYASLVEVPQTPIDSSTAITSVPWAPFTAYAAGDYVTYGLALYQALIANTSTANFTNDLTQAWWFETDTGNSDPFNTNPGSQYPSGWAYQFLLPDDFVLLSDLNDLGESGDPEEQWEIMGKYLYTDEPTAIIKYVQHSEDTTQYDSLFVSALVYLIASKIATKLRQDDAKMAMQMVSLYDKALTNARTKDSNERKPRRFSPVANSRFVASRWRSTNS